MVNGLRLSSPLPPSFISSQHLQITAVQNYRNNPSETHQVHLNAQVLSLASYYNGFDVKDFYVETVNRRTAQCRSTGDPHYVTFDGLVSSHIHLSVQFTAPPFIQTLRSDQSNPPESDQHLTSLGAAVMNLTLLQTSMDTDLHPHNLLHSLPHIAVLALLRGVNTDVVPCTRS